MKTYIRKSRSTGNDYLYQRRPSKWDEADFMRRGKSSEILPPDLRVSTTCPRCKRIVKVDNDGLVEEHTLGKVLDAPKCFLGWIEVGKVVFMPPGKRSASMIRRRREDVIKYRKVKN